MTFDPHIWCITYICCSRGICHTIDTKNLSSGNITSWKVHSSDKFTSSMEIFWGRYGILCQLCIWPLTLSIYSKYVLLLNLNLSIRSSLNGQINYILNQSSMTFDLWPIIFDASLMITVPGESFTLKTWIYVYTNITSQRTLRAIQGGPKIAERHTSGNKDIRWLVSVDGVSFPEKNDTKISHFG